MDRNASAQGQGVNSNYSENNHKVDNDMSQHNMQGTREDTKLTDTSYTGQNMSGIKISADTEIKIETSDGALALASVSSKGNDILPVYFELRTDGCVMMVKAEDGLCTDGIELCTDGRVLKAKAEDGLCADGTELCTDGLVMKAEAEDGLCADGMELRTDGCVMKAKAEDRLFADDNKPELSDDKFEASIPTIQSSEHSSQDKVNTSSSDALKVESSHNMNATDIKGESSPNMNTTALKVERLHTNTLDIKVGSSHMNTPDTIKISAPKQEGSSASADEVQKEVINKLNISEEEPSVREHLTSSVESPSKVIVNRQTESLMNIMAYEGDSDDSEQSDTEVEEKRPDPIKPQENKSNSEKNWRENQEESSGSSESGSDSSTSTLSSDSDDSDSDNSDGESNNSGADSASVIDVSDDGIRTESPVLSKINSNNTGAVKKTSKSLFDFQEYLPPIPDLSKLNINDKEEFMHLGRISAIISELVTIEAIPGIPAFDLDSMLFVDDESKKKPLGPIFDVLGPVTEPIYCVRFNDEDEIKKMGIKSGMKVYAAPKSDEFSKFVFVKELMRMKGTDASWLNDQEQPVDLTEYSDEELERHYAAANAKPAGKGCVKRKLNDGSLERHKRYEKTMNQCNTLNTRVCRLMDAQRNLSKQIRTNVRDDLQPIVAPAGCPELPDVPPEFNPTVPPPGFGHPSPYGYPAQAMLFTPSPSTLGQPSNLNSLSSYNPGSGTFNAPVPAVFTGPVQFGSFYANQPPAPHSLGPPPTRWQRCDNFRRGRHNQRGGHRQNPDNYYTNNSRNLRDAGPSYHPF